MMRHPHTFSLLSIAASLVTAFFAGPVSAQAWPAKQPIRIISPYAPGGTTDVLARLLAPRLQEKLGQTVIVENRPGAGGNIGTDTVAKAPADGYTLLLAASGPLVISPSLYAQLPYTPLKDFTYVAAHRQRRLCRRGQCGRRYQLATRSHHPGQAG